MRAVLDANVLISAVISRKGAPAALLRRWRDGDFELVVSPSLLVEVERALGYPKLRSLVTPEDAVAFNGLLRERAVVAKDAGGPPSVASSDPRDDYLIALAEQERAYLVSGDSHLLAVAGRLPVHSPREFLTILEG